MVRVLTLSLAAGLLVGLLFGLVRPVEAGKEKKKQATAARVVLGTIRSADEGKSLSLATLGGKKMKQVGAAELKITNRTRIEYVGIDDRNEQKLQPGYFVMVALDPNNKDTAASIKVCKAPTAGKQKQKKNKNKTEK
jgi:hypothetical protein